MERADFLATVDSTWFSQCLIDEALVEALKKIKLIICDVDGTLTDASVYVSAEGEGGRLFNVQDGFIVKPAMQAGLHIAFVSGKDNKSTIERAKKLGIPENLCIVGMESKHEVVKKLQQEQNVTTNEILVFGDDFLDADIKLHKLAGMYVCPANAIFYLQPLADLIIPRGGGQGAFRLLLDLILYVQNKHFAQQLIEQALQ